MNEIPSSGKQFTVYTNLSNQILRVYPWPKYCMLDMELKF